MKNQLPTYSKILKRRPPTTLFHYTTPAGLISISQSKKIWATDIRFLNDKKEFQHSLETTHFIIESFYKIGNNSRKLTDLEYIFIEYLRINLGKKWNPEVFIASFTEEGDLLSQWRGYCAKGGFSLGFSGDLLDEVAKRHKGHLLPCVYDYKTQKLMLEELLVSYSKKYDEEVRKENKKNPDQIADSLSNEFIISLFSIAPMLKHDSFKEEKEWRIVSSRLIAEPDIQFRPNESIVIPYIEISLCKNESEIEFNKICIGPASNNEYSRDAVMQLLSKNRIAKNSILFSSVPYRSS